MKFLDFTTLFDTEPANLAVLSTFQLDADFFERRLLHCRALREARRILVFMDAGQWINLLRQDVSARFLNRRYLVVPIRRSQGVFHPKLNLLVTERGGQIQCGSNNLTRSGCSSNLELLNSFSANLEGDSEEMIRLAQEAFAFFKRACNDAEKETGRIAQQWLDEVSKVAPWLKVSLPQNNNRNVRLIHTYDGKIWDRIAAIIDQSLPQKIMVISPFYDVNCEMAKRIYQRWPKCKIELIVQQKTTNLLTSSMGKFRRRVSLSELRNTSRRLHAKLLAWESPTGTSCLVGSANLTTAAFDSRNVEACLLVSDAEDFVNGLFDKQFGKRPIPFEDFEPGTEKEPDPIDEGSTILELRSAVLTEAGELRVSYRHRLKVKPSRLRVAIRTPDEKRPRAILSVPNTDDVMSTVIPPESALKDTHGTLLASLIAEIENEKHESDSIWIIQEERLTYEPNGDGSSSSKSQVEESGEGLTEILEAIGKQGGVGAVIEYLRHLDIRFNDGGDEHRLGRKFRLHIRDPFHPDVAPEWLVQGEAETTTLAEAIYDFVDRHEKQRLRKHAKRGNINGIENFLNIFTALIRLLYIYYLRGVVHRDQLIGRLCKYLEIATIGIETPEDDCEGYLYSVHDNLRDSTYLQEVCKEVNLLGQIKAALVIVQNVRFIPGEKATWGFPPTRPSECLPHINKKLTDTIKDLDMVLPSKNSVLKALDEYKMFSAEKMAEFEKEIVP